MRLVLEGEPPFTSSGLQTQTQALLDGEQQKLLLQWAVAWIQLKNWATRGAPEIQFFSWDWRSGGALTKSTAVCWIKMTDCDIV